MSHVILHLVRFTRGGVPLRTGNMVEYDTVNMKTANVPETNKFLVRESWKTGSYSQ